MLLSYFSSILTLFYSVSFMFIHEDMSQRSLREFFFPRKKLSESQKITSKRLQFFKIFWESMPPDPPRRIAPVAPCYVGLQPTSNLDSHFQNPVGRWHDPVDSRFDEVRKASKTLGL